MSAHTPRPWSSREIGGAVVIETQSPPQAVLYRIAEVSYSTDDLEEQNDANTRLMVAAPDLLFYCHAIADLASGYDAGGAIGPKEPYRWETIARIALDYARAAIAKAEKP